MRCDLRASLMTLSLMPLVFGLAGSRPALGGAELASVNGTITDSQGQPLAGVHVTLSGIRSGPVTVVTSGDGVYRFWAVQPNSGYRIEARQDGYRTIEYDGLTFGLGERRHVHFRLRRPDEREAVILLSRDPFPHDDLVRGFTDGLGVPVRVIDLDAEPDPDEAVRQVGAEKPNVILATGLMAGRLVRSRLRETPSILTLISDPRRYDLEAPNICFLASNPEPADVLGRLATLLPDVRRVGLIYDAEYSELLARDLREAAGRRGLRVELSPCYRPGDLGHVLEGLVGRIDALIVPYDPLAATQGVLEAVTRWSLRHRVALLAPQSTWVSRGALLSYGESLDRIGAQAQRIARQIVFEGRQAGDFGLQLPDEPVLSVNEKTAAILGVTLPSGTPGADVAPAPPPPSR